MSNKLEILSLFGFTKDPFFAKDMVSADAKRVKGLLAMAISAHAQVAIIGDRGVGKTRAVNAALRDMKIQPVRVLAPDKTRVTAGDIQEALLQELAPAESVRHDHEIRVRMLRRILGEAARKREIVVVIEEAHRLHHNTLRCVKNLRELDWMGETHLFSVVLIGQFDCTRAVGLSEVRLRTETVQMHGLTQGEIADYIRATVGRVFEDGAVAALAMLPDAHNYLDLQELLIRCMEMALAAGREQVIVEDAEAISKAFSRDECPPAAKSQSRGVAAVESVLARRKSGNGAPSRATA